LLDDVGFAASSAFGGPCATPTAERLAGDGLKYNRFHTTALCAPTRSALLTGRNHHSVGMGVITELATSAPGYSSIRPNTCAPLAQTLLLNGYSTSQFGKCHEVPVWQTSPMGPFDAWPTGGSGFEYFYGFIGGETNQYYPAVYEGTTPVEPEKTPEEGYHFTEDMTDKAIQWARQQKSLMPDKPFFMYFAPGATHAPHHVPTEWSDKYKGRFDQGWDALREETLARQKELGVVPAETELTARHEEIPAWDDMPDELKPILARQMEVYAGFLEHTDHHIGRLVDALEDLEAAGLPQPTVVNGIAQQPIEGVSMAYSFDGASEADRHETQYFEMFCNRGIYHQGWTAVTRHSTPWVMGPQLPPFDEDVWELYDTNTDWSQAHDLAAEMPGKLAELQQLWLEEARKYNVLPLDDRRMERFDAELVGRPELVKGNSQLLFGGMGRLTENSLLNIKNKSHAVTAEVVVPETGAEGVIIAQGGAFAGWSLYVKAGRPTYCYNLLGLQRFKIETEAAIPPGTHQVRMEFAYDGGGLAKGGTVTLYLDGEKTGEGRVEATVPLIFSADETADVGRDTASPVSDDYEGESSVFTGTVNWVQIDLGEDAEDADHLITPEERLRVAMARQ
jgi:arylsulfatase A-like enzyme